jgi:hypothetical protein
MSKLHSKILVVSFSHMFVLPTPNNISTLMQPFQSILGGIIKQVVTIYPKPVIFSEFLGKWDHIVVKKPELFFKLPCQWIFCQLCLTCPDLYAVYISINNRLFQLW